MEKKRIGTGLIMIFTTLFILMIAWCLYGNRAYAISLFSNKSDITPVTTEESGNVLRTGENALLNGSINASEIISISFLDNFDEITDDAWDVSELENGSVMAWVVDMGEGYSLYVAGRGGVDANADSSYLFGGSVAEGTNYSNLQEINFENCFYTGNAADMNHMFSGCSSLVSLDLNSFDTSLVMDMSGMFSSCSSLSVLLINHFNTERVASMSSMFSGCSSLTALDLEHFDTSSVWDSGYGSMFNGCSSLQTLNISNFDTSNSITYMGYMFCDCSSLTELDVSGFDTSKVCIMNKMFCNCSSLKKLDVSGFDTSNVTEMYKMFYNCSSLENLDISGFNMENVENRIDMLTGSCLYSLNITPASGNVMVNSIYSETSTSSYHLPGSDIDKRLIRVIVFLDTLDGAPDDAWDISEAGNGSVITWLERMDGTEYYYMYIAGEGGVDAPQNSSYLFSEYTQLFSMYFNDSFCTSNVTSMYGMFMNCWSLNSLDLSSFDTSNVMDMGSMFYNCSNLVGLDVSSFDTSNVTSVREMFYSCKRLRELDLNGFETSNIIDIYQVFAECGSMLGVDASIFEIGSQAAEKLENPSGNVLMRELYNYTETTLEYTSLWGTEGIFGYEYDRSSIITITFLDSLDDVPEDAWDVSEAWDGSVMAWLIRKEDDFAYDKYGLDLDGEGYDMFIAGNGGVDANPDSSCLFAKYDNLISINFNGCFYTGNVENMDFMFYNCIRLESMDIGCFDTRNVQSFFNMFYNCWRIDTLDVSDFDVSKAQNFNGMFCECELLSSLDLSFWKTSSAIDMSNMFLMCEVIKTLDLSNFDTSKVEDMSHMFAGCYALQELDVSSFDTSSVTDMSYMFSGCDSLENFNINNFTVTFANMDNIFKDTKWKDDWWYTVYTIAAD